MTYPVPGAQRAPTDVVGRRIGAYLLDAVFGAILSGIVLFTVLHHTTGNADNTCNQSSVKDHTVLCMQVSSDVYSISTHDSWKIAGANGAWFLFDLVTIQGIAGGTLGKLIVGIRSVDGNGQLCGLWRAFLRSLPFAIGIGGAVLRTRGALQGLGFLGEACIVIELVVLLVRKDHRRVGDLLGGTWVIDKHAVGYPVPDPSTLYVPAEWSGGWGPHATGGPDTGGNDPAHGSLEPPAPPPQWDQARDAYIWWDAERREWLEHDRSSGQWKPISR